MGAVAFGLNFGRPAGIPTDEFLFLVGLLLVVIFTVIGVFGVKLTGLLLQAMFWVPAVLTFYVFGLLSQANNATILSEMQNVLGVTLGKYVAAATHSTLTDI